MSLYRLWTIFRKEVRHIWRDKRILFLVTLSPAIMLVTFSYLFSVEVQKVRLGIWDLDQSALSRAFVASITADGKFVAAETLSDYDSLREGLRRSEIHLGLVIPPGFEGHLQAGERTPVQVIADGSDAIAMLRSLGTLRERIARFDERFGGRGGPLAATITVDAQAWYNRDLNSKIATVPGLIPIVMILPSLAIALAVTRERELGSFETLITAPVRAFEYILGKLLPYMLFGLFSASLAMLLAILWFQVPLRGGALDLGLVTLLYLFASLSETLFICSFLSSQGSAMRIVLIIFFIPSFFLAGVIMPVDSQSGAGQVASLFLPASYFVPILRAVFLKGSDLAQLGSLSLRLFILGAVPLLLSGLAFKKQVD